MTTEVKKYLISIAVIGSHNALNKIIKNIYQDFSLVFYKTLIKTVVDKEEIELELLTKDDCEYNEENDKYIGHFVISSTVNTRDPRKITNKLIDDEFIINSFIKKWSREQVRILYGVKELDFKEEEYLTV